MKRWILMAAVLVGSLLAAGCGDGVASTRRDQQVSYTKGLKQDFRMLNDDITLLLLNERPSRLSRFRVR